MLRQSITIGATVCALALCAAAPASAVVTKAPNGKHYSYLPLMRSSARAAKPFAANGHLDYHGGPVMPSNQQFAIFWAPSGFSFPPGYQSGIVKFLKDVAADRNLPTNTYSVGAQYEDSSGTFATSAMSFGGAINDTSPYPANACNPYTGIGGLVYNTCISDAQLSAEVDDVVAANSLPRGLTNEYFVFLPQGVGSCFPTGDPPSGSGPSCFDQTGGFCAYHSHTSTGGATIYANQSFTPADPRACGNGNYPNGTANSNVDDQLSVLSHETNESREDPLGTGWWNSNTGAEGADQCRAAYGPFLGGTHGVDGFNQEINGNHFILQEDWSNAANGCEQRYNLTGTTFGPFSAKVGERVTFSVKFKDREGGHLKSASWNFGDGSEADGAKVDHTFHQAGRFTVNTVACTNTKLCLFGRRKVEVKKAGHRHRKVEVAAAPLRAR